MPVQTVSPHDVRQRREAGQRVEIIDVRTPAEFAQLHVDGARSVPLDVLDVNALLRERNGAAGGEDPLYLICQSGARAARACEMFEAAGFTNVVSIAGGTSAWARAGLPVVRGARRTISLERQVRIGAGSLVLVGALLGWLAHPAFFGLCAVIGAGLLFAGVTDWCGMGLMLAKMPWNRGGGGCAAR
jgi:rhodanese-related sulfurtransferase